MQKQLAHGHSCESGYDQDQLHLRAASLGRRPAGVCHAFLEDPKHLLLQHPLAGMIDLIFPELAGMQQPAMQALEISGRQRLVTG